MSAKKAKRRAAAWIFCGAADPSTWDHVPPKNLFNKPSPGNLIKVPSCSDCNVGASKDDEYLRLMMTLREDVSETPLAREPADSAMRALRRPEFRGLLSLLVSITEEMDVRTPAGIFLGRRGVYKPDLSRLYRVIARTVRGLFYDERRYPLPQSYGVKTYLLPEEWDIKHQDTDVSRTAVEFATALQRQSAPRIIGRREVLCWWQSTAEDPNVSA